MLKEDGLNSNRYLHECIENRLKEIEKLEKISEAAESDERFLNQMTCINKFYTTMALISHYNKAIRYRIMENVAKTDELNVIFIGEEKSGKTTLINKFKKLILHKMAQNPEVTYKDRPSMPLTTQAGRFNMVEVESLTNPLTYENNDKNN